MNMVYILSDFAQKQGYAVESYENVDSTNLIAQRRAYAGHRGYLWIVAQEQSQGMARRGRTWYSPKGNLYCSLLLIDDIVHQTAAQLSFVAGVSMVEAIKQFVKDENQANSIVSLKWPNDILLKESKSSGILLEIFKLTFQQYALVIGIGMNVNCHYEDAPYPTSSLKNIGLHVETEQLFTVLTEYFSKNYLLWKQPGGCDIIRKKWLLYSAHVGQHIKIINDKKVIEGIFDGLDSAFNCIIKQKNGQQVTITAGDVHFGLAASAKASRY
ncbi:biotin--[acetyl-CoA-carboxylase] ligase [Bartonella quintana]|uniref:biotin--[biotin carboxyl-carrier protein] ligase n=3 Tax=Bartonella quintana TaxID=803 RepID=A0A0H3M0F1_BARQU|nr:biotin--[acetyl-CoA-carboxylase] ligase [Bartonella quintana]ETS11537.1 biotin-[acetyl-CoA-carboxylase] ligase [Bartonella quintana BQ2-D70]ETS14343.1 biotin-[acetyl-CoA-carboxylase] ligase [Bartonella quintana JK 73rel]ETS16030.1 biotin-[acetyl-CoA-carboxylase] ligase [Bartonella quintana JK 73]ETS18032.1 biotin-[acetyl-CoA-carboxylase] ligase [Bartonella quintana JK 7]ETS18861.1 biotin-[acetyl-CoA-carboxylase] ligase [Bartonella quintana JK 12]